MPTLSMDVYDLNYIDMHIFHSFIFNRMDDSLLMDFLMPNGIIIQHNVSPSMNLADIKSELWDRAREFPLFGLLRNQASYHLTCVSTKGQPIELLDENLFLYDCDIFAKCLKLVERKGNEDEKRLNTSIGKLIGKGLHDFDALKNPEINDFRWKLRNECDTVVRDRNKLPWNSQILYRYPYRLAMSKELPQYILERMPSETLYVGVQFTKSLNVESMFTIQVHHSVLPSSLLEMAFTKKMRTLEGDSNCKAAPAEHILKILGREEYLVEEVPLSMYVSVREFICQNQIHIGGSHAPQHHLQLIVISKATINVNIDEIYGKMEDVSARQSRASVSASTISKKKSIHFKSSWDVEDLFKVKIGAMSNLQVETEGLSEIYLELGLYHASDPLCATEWTQPASVDAHTAKLDSDISFPMKVCNVPRSTRLCIAVYEHRYVNSKSKAKYLSDSTAKYLKTPIAWVNTTVYDYRGHLKSGSMTLYCWSAVGEVGDLDFPNPLGTVVANPKHDRAVAITVFFTKYANSSTVVYPNKELIQANVSQDTDYEPLNQEKRDELRRITAGDPLCELHEQEKKNIWAYRRYCMKHEPHILPKLLQCVNWGRNEEVAEMIYLLEKWVKLPPNLALELLDYAYPEPTVRSYAIDCISFMSDEDLHLYLLQLVQALKHENYLYCDLVQFLLERALKNQLIGHFLFWHLRSEMHGPMVSIRFGLILEAYCRGAVEHMKPLQKQIDAIAIMKELQQFIVERKSGRSAKDQMNIYFQDVLRHNKYQLSNFLNPIDPSLCINSIRNNCCKSMESKMQPLWLVFENGDAHGKDVCILYKKGDDLRQDMLTLQMIRIMDKLWKDNGLDLRMNPYSCLSTDHREGIIQVVTKASTIANIQQERKGIWSALKRECLLEWLETHNPSKESLDRAIHEFTLSCAGYSVATYVLGVADRHNDNIMVMPNGQLFHIDFGHILGNYKEKLGIRRERQPFVLSNDIIYVIQKGKDSKSEYFEEFKTKCEMAFMLLRQHGSFIISLFAMMISTGLPELQGEKDLAYLRDALKLNLNDEDALLHFRSKFQEALKNILTTTMNWAIHSFRKNI